MHTQIVAENKPKGPTLRDTEHEARALVAIARAAIETPFYVRRGHFEHRATLASTLASLPLLFKKDVRSALPKTWVPAGRDVRAELESGDLELVETSGSTEDRLRILWDKGWWLRQEERAMRTNALVARAMDSIGSPYKEGILTTPVCGGGVCHTGDLSFEERKDGPHLFLNMRPDPTFWRADDMTRMLDELAKHHTVGLEADPAYLAALAEHAHTIGRTIDVSGFVQLTYAQTTQAHLRSIRRAYRGPIFQLYGASEVGVLFMQGEDGWLHHAPITTHVELLRAKVPTPGSEDVALVVVTTLDRIAQPLLRFVVGDLVSVNPLVPPRFTTVPTLRSIEGRLQDAVVRPDGAIVTCAAIDRAIAAIDDVVQFQVQQREPGSIEVDVVSRSDARSAVSHALLPLCEGMQVEVRNVTAIAAEASGKFRVVRRAFPIDVEATFEVSPVGLS
jgi:phenylacetate-CoA ligase